MDLVFDGTLRVDYGFVFFYAGEPVEQPELTSARGGQQNGLCGAAEPGVLSLVTGTHTGSVGLRIELWESAPDLDEGAEDIVEVSLEVTELDAALTTFDDAVDVRLSHTGPHRVRVSATGMDAATEDPLAAEDRIIDRYVLSMWPAPMSTDAVLRQTSRSAAYWHDVARTTPPPPDARERAATRDAVDAERRRVDEELAGAADAQWWGGRTPSDALRAAGPQASAVARLDRDLAEALAALAPVRQRQVAVWAARWAVDACDTADQPTVQAAMQSLERGELATSATGVAW